MKNPASKQLDYSPTLRTPWGRRAPGRRGPSPQDARGHSPGGPQSDGHGHVPIHVYDAATGAPVVVILRPGKTPSGVEVRKLLSRLIGRIRRHWPSTHITIRGDGHYGRDEAMTWCENASIDYIFGLAGNVVLDRLVEPTADDIRVRRAESQAEVLRGFAETRYAAKSWNNERRVVGQRQPRR
jgi:Transposase DDE domain group 1